MNREILRLALPSIISNITVPLLSLADIAIMGHIGNATYLAAISIGTMVFNVMYWLVEFLRMSISGVTSQAYGRKDEQFYKEMFTHGIQMALFFGGLIILLQFPIKELALWLLQTTKDARPLVTQYFNVCIWGAPTVLGCYSLNGWLVGMQNTLIPMRVAISQNILNILLSVFFVFVMHMQIQGVALGTVLSQWIGFLLLYVFANHRYKVSVNWEYLFDYRRVLRSPLKVTSVAFFFRTFCLVAVNLFFTSAGSQQGNTVLAVNTLLMTFFFIFSYFMDGFAFAGEALSGKFVGAREPHNLILMNRNLLKWSAGMVVVFTIVYYLGGDLFLSLLTNDQEVILASKPYFFWVLVVPVCGVLAFIYDGVYTGMTRSKDMFLSCLIGASVFFLIFLIPSLLTTNNRLWLAFNAYLFLRSAYLFIRFRH